MAKPYIKQDRFGNAYQSICCYQKEGMTSKGNELPYVGYVELGGKIYKLAISPNSVKSNKKDRERVTIVTVTAYQKKQNYQSM